MTPQPDGAEVVLRTAVVLSVTEQACATWSDGTLNTVAFAPPFPGPRIERVWPGNLVAIATAVDGREAVVWRWFDAVVLGTGASDQVRLWEPGHGEVTARPNAHYRPMQPGSRAYASAGLPGAAWWVGGPAVPSGSQPEVELDAVRSFFEADDRWTAVFS